MIELLQQRSDSKRSQEHLGRLEDGLTAKITERNRILTLFRKGRINEVDLDRQMDQIDREEAGLRSNIEDVSARVLGADGVGRVQSAEELLEKLRGRFDAGVSWEVKRHLIEALVGVIRIDTSEENGKRCASIAITYRFGICVSTCTDTRADNNCTLEKVYRPAKRWVTRQQSQIEGPSR